MVSDTHHANNMTRNFLVFVACGSRDRGGKKENLQHCINALQLASRTQRIELRHGYVSYHYSSDTKPRSVCTDMQIIMHTFIDDLKATASVTDPYAKDVAWNGCDSVHYLNQ